MHCTWISTYITGMNSGAITHYCISQTNRTEDNHYQQQNHQILFFYFFYYSIYSYTLSLSHQLNYYSEGYTVYVFFYINILTIQELLYVIWLLPWPIQVWQAALYDRLWSKIKENMLHFTEGSVPAIHWTNRPITTPITCSGWVFLESMPHLTAYPHFLPFGDRSPEMH